MSASLRCENLGEKKEAETRRDETIPAANFSHVSTFEGPDRLLLSPADVSDADQGEKMCKCVCGAYVRACAWICVLCVCVHEKERTGLQSVIMRIISPVMRKGCTRPPHTGLVAHKHWSHRWTRLRRLLR